MKKYNFLSLLIFAASLTLSISSCLSDDEHFIDFSNIGVVVDIPQSANYGIADNQTFTISKTPTPYSFDVKVEAPTKTLSNIDIVLSVDKAYLPPFNAANNKTYLLLPDSTFSISNGTVTVPAGKELGAFTINFMTNKIDTAIASDPTKGYALPITIMSASNGVIPSANYGTKVIVVSVKK